jgi:hypothetical protein
MRIRYRLMLVAAVALTVSLLTVVLWPTSPVAPEAAPSEPPIATGPGTPAPEPVSPKVVARERVEPVPASNEERPATVVALAPGDVPPEPEVANPPPQENDAIEPELPQTAQWRLEKTTHLTALLGRDVERLEREREDAEARGDERRSEQLGTLLSRNRARLHELREELRELGEAVKEESSTE